MNRSRGSFASPMTHSHHSPGGESFWRRSLASEWLAPAVSGMLCVLFAIAGWLLIPRHGSVVTQEDLVSRSR